MPGLHDCLFLGAKSFQYAEKVLKMSGAGLNFYARADGTARGVQVWTVNGMRKGGDYGTQTSTVQPDLMPVSP
jgi:hypothetical protein